MSNITQGFSIGKMGSRLLIASSALAFLFYLGLPISSLAATTYSPTENFDSYTAGASLNGDNGGTGWVNTWTASNVTTVTAPTGGQGGKAMHIQGTSATDASATRSFSPMRSGIVSFRIYTTINAFDNVHSYSLLSGATNPIIVQWDNNYPNGVGTAGNLDAFDVTTGQYVTVATGLTANAWHTVQIKFGHTDNKFAVSVDGGSYSADKTYWLF